MPDSSPFSLDGVWELVGFPEGAYACDHPAGLTRLDLPRLAALVPGNIEIDLQRAGLISDPFLSENIAQLRPYETYEWWFLRKFDLPAVPLGTCAWELVFEGLDLLAEIWVNGSKVGETANMLIPHRFSVTELLRWGQTNEITVRLRSALNHARRQTYSPWEMSWEQRWEGLRLRKAPHVWGWDILPRAVSAGIWRSVSLQPVHADDFDWIYFWTRSADERSATLGVRFQVRTAGGLEDLRLEFSGTCRERSFVYEWPLEFTAGGCSIPIHRPYLWWPRGCGPADLYTLTTRFYRGDTLLAERLDRVGLRELRLETTPTAGALNEREALAQESGRWDQAPDPLHHFLIRINGEPIMVKGTNWVPVDALHSRDLPRLPRALELARDSGVNMIRCWGGGVYEHDSFYEFCDENGILVWQDLAFACCAYPQDEAFLHQAAHEVEQVALRLRNHPCLALWCGDNENDVLYLSEGLNPAHNRLTRETIPQVLRRLDPHRAYLPSSPYISPEAYDTGAPPPEQHLWGPRGYFKSSYYTRHSAHFIGEIGYHGCPDPASLRKFLAPEEVWPWQGNPAWQAHAVYHWRKSAIDRDRIRLMANQILEFFGDIPDNLEDFALASQITQAEAKKFFIESTRLRKWRTSGILWWNLIDGWPQFSDAVVDYYFTPKLAYHYIRRCQQPVSLVIGEAGGGKYLPLVACNDTLQEVHLTYRVWDADQEGVLVRGECSIPANQNWQIARIRTYASEQRMLLYQWKVGDENFGGHYLCGSPPFRLEDYRLWLAHISHLPQPFPLPG